MTEHIPKFKCHSSLRTSCDPPDFPGPSGHCVCACVWLHVFSTLTVQATTARARCWSLRSRTRWCPTWTWAACRGPSCSSSTSCTAAGSGGTAPSSPTSSWRLWRACSRRPSTRTSAPGSSWPAKSTSGRRRSRSVQLPASFHELFQFWLFYGPVQTEPTELLSSCNSEYC